MSAAIMPETIGAPPASAAPAARSRRPIVLPVLALLAIAGGTWAFRTYSYGQAHESTDNAQIDGHIVPVVAKVGGYVAAVNAGENQHVDAGAVLVRIDDREYAVRLSQAEADLAAAQATAGAGRDVGQAEALVRSATGQTAAGEAQVAAARATLAKAESDLQRYQELAAQQIVSQQVLDASRAAVAVARAQVAAAERQTQATGAGVANAQAGVRLAEARLAGARAARENAALQLSYATITAPMAGVVARKTVEIGQLVQPGQTLLSVVADTGTFVTANFKETQLDRIKVGQPVEFSVDAYDGAVAHGVVESISAASGAKFALLPPDNATGNFTKVVQRIPVRIRVTQGLGADRPLRPGMSVDAHVSVR